ncbi:hypothetical protein AAGS61_09310 [Lysinibacillus sp. KU-BSD001]|uniref:hypothetical protein n=1 Tax=Lysinibacillus sp. KU-BSD001 TaxID=3141328 RepID=UPI0036E13B29
MENIYGSAIWVDILPRVFIILCFYCTLMFFRHLKDGDERLIKQSTLAAVFCLAVALLIPVMYHFYLYTQMMQ